jgi:CHAD domain-containing protein
MRSPKNSFDLRTALSKEISAAIAELGEGPLKNKAAHSCRIRLKRARALAAVGRVSAPGLADVFDDSARGVMQTLGEARDLAVLTKAARSWKKAAKVRESKVFALAQKALATATQAQAPLDLSALRARLSDLLALAHVWPETSPRQIEKGARRLIRRARRAFYRGAGTAAERHEWRKREHDRLYAAKLLGDAWPGGRKRRRKTGEKLTDLLGRERDRAMLAAYIAAQPIADKQIKRARRALRADAKQLAQRIDKLGAALHADRA